MASGRYWKHYFNKKLWDYPLRTLMLPPFLHKYLRHRYKKDFLRKSKTNFTFDCENEWEELTLHLEKQPTAKQAKPCTWAIPPYTWAIPPCIWTIMHFGQSFWNLPAWVFFFFSELTLLHISQKKKANPPTNQPTNQPEKGKGNTCAQQWRVEIVTQKEWTLNNEIAHTQIQRYVWTWNQHKFLL